MLLALTILIGWITHSVKTITIIPNFAPMQFNDALCFIFCSTAFLISLSRTHNLLRISLAMTTTFIALLTLTQYPLHANFGIDTLFIKPFWINSHHPGRMAPNNALAFIFISLSLISFGSSSRLPRSKALIISLLASMSFALGLVPLLGYLTRIETAYTWGTFTMIPIESACCFVLLSIATISSVWNRSETESIWLPIPIFIAFLTVTLSMSAAVYNKELNQFKQILENNAQNAATLTQQTLENLIKALTRMANRWDAEKKNQIALWHTDAQAYIHDFSFLLALEILDKNLTIQAIEPSATYADLIGKNLNDNPQRQRVIQEAIRTRAPTISKHLTLKQGGQGFLCFIPLFIDNQFAGMLVAVFRANNLFDYIFTSARFPSYYVTIYEQGHAIFSNAPPQKDDSLRTHHNTIMHYKNIAWVLTLRPNTDALANRVSQSYLVIFCFGFIMSMLVSLCAYLVLKSYEKRNALTESENRYRMILDGIKDYAIFMLTPSGNVKSWNIGAQRLEGYSDREIIGEPFSIFYTAEDIANNVPKHNLNIARTQGRYEEENIRVRKDGSHFWAKVLVEALYDPDEKLVGFVNITRDITDSRQMELERSKLIALIDESSDFVGISDLQGNLQYHNPSARLLIGLPHDYDMSQMNISDVHPAWATKQIMEEGIPTVFEKGIWTGETALLHRNGQEIPVLQAFNLHRDAMGEPVCFTTIMRDITERKAQEEATKASEETFRLAMHYASIGMALVSTEGKWLNVNQALLNMMGYSKEEFLAMDFQTITHPDDLKKDLGYLVRMLNKEIDNYRMEKRYFHKSGHIIWGLLDVSLIWNTDGTPQYFISQVQNITARKKAEAANKKLMEALANSNAELERFAYVASHDLQEPIRMINNFGALLLAEKLTALDDEAKEYLRIMTNAGIRMRDVINDLLAYSHVSKQTTFVRFNGEEILQGALENIKTLVEEQKAQITHDPLPILYGNPMQIMRVLQNLLTNAIKYQRNGNTPVIHVGLEDQGENWRLSIKDNGLGIEEQFIDEIFEPFRRLHTWESIKGSGLGLSICKKIAEIHEGTLSVTSVIGSGSVFFLTIPKCDKH